MLSTAIRRVAGGAAATVTPTVATGLTLPGTNTNYIKAPDSAGLSPTGDLDLRALIAMDSWRPSAQKGIISKANNAGGQRSYSLVIGTGGASNGAPQLTWYADGATAITTGSTVNNAITDGVLTWIRATLECNVGGVWNVKFYTAPDVSGTPGTWTQLGATKTGAVPTSVFDGSAAVSLGSTIGDTANGVGLWSGKFVKAEIRSGVGGTVGGSFDATAITRTGPRSPATMTDTQGNIWTPQGTGWDWATT